MQSTIEKHILTTTYNKVRCGLKYISSINPVLNVLNEKEIVGFMVLGASIIDEFKKEPPEDIFEEDHFPLQKDYRSTAAS